MFYLSRNALFLILHIIINLYRQLNCTEQTVFNKHEGSKLHSPSGILQNLQESSLTNKKTSIDRTHKQRIKRSTLSIQNGRRYALDGSSQHLRVRRNVLNLNIETDDFTTQSKDAHIIHAQYVRSDIPKPQSGSGISDSFNAPYTNILIEKPTTSLVSSSDKRSNSGYLSASVKKDISALQSPTTSYTTSRSATTKYQQVTTRQQTHDILEEFLKPTSKNEQNVVQYITAKTRNVVKANTSTTRPSTTVVGNRKSIIEFQEPSTAHRVTEKASPKSIISFFEEEDKPTPTIIREFDEFAANDNTDTDTDYNKENDNFEEDETSISETRIPIISQLISGTLDVGNNTQQDNLTNRTKPFIKTTDIDSQAPDYDIMLDNFYNNKNNITTPLFTQNINNITDSLQTKNAGKTRDDIDKHFLTLIEEELEPKNESISNAASIVETKLPNINIDSKDEIDITDLVKTYHNISGKNLAEMNLRNRNVNKTNENKINFHYTKNSNGAKCMDGSTPGYYYRKGFGSGKRKWIVHLHGGAWCYDLRSCMKRRSSILGSTLHSKNEKISSFFHGILSKNGAVNPRFYKWNVAVLSYCDGGLFSGNRKSSITGKGKEFYFEGRKVLKSLLDNLLPQGLSHASDVVLSGTSAGGLALALQGDYIRGYIPEKARVRGLIDAGLFLDEDSTSETENMARKQFKALYSLHRPVLNKKCLKSFARKDKYRCLFPQNTLQYIKLPIYIVNSLYDHWQLSYLEGVNCIYDDAKCGTDQRDKILNFRNKMYQTINKIRKFKNDTGVFANSCIAHGQVILDYTWSKVKVNNRHIGEAFYDWYKGNEIQLGSRRYYSADCKYPCNGSCPRVLAQKCVANFKGASEHRRKRDAELC